MERDSQRAEPLPEGQRRRALANVARKNLIDLRGKRRIEQQIWGWTIGPAIAGFGRVMPGRKGPQAALGHDSADSGRSADVAFIGELRADAPVAITSPMSAENPLNVFAHLQVRELGIGGRRRVVKSAIRLRAVSTSSRP